MYNLELAQILMLQAKAGQIEVYYPNNGKKISSRELRKLLVVNDSLYIESDRGKLELKIIPMELGEFNISSMIVNQTFIFDSDSLIISSRINSVIVTCQLWNSDKIIELFEVRFSN
jgi:hypothetical protein